MKITFLGAAKTVTGSCYLVETAKSRFLLDCGMFQGRSEENALNEQPFPFNPGEIDFILLSHAHIDHSGRIPKIYKEGFKGRIIATRATADLCSIMLPDSGHIQEFENEWINRKRQRAGKKPVEPLYTYQDAVDCRRLFVGVGYGETVQAASDVKVRFNDAGHILGSSILEIWAAENGKETKLVFSGDLGNKGMPILRDPALISDADCVMIESTYGNRLHESNRNKAEHFVDVITETIEKGGNVIIPSFAVGRTQEIIYELNKQMEKHGDKINRIMDIPVYVDSPLAVSATQVFRQNLDCYDEEARAYVENGDNPLDFPSLQFTASPDESKALNDMPGSKIIISASGMCEAGRIKHHLKHNLWRKDSTVLFVGYQAEGTLGRRLINGEKNVRIFGEDIRVNARIEMIEGFSGHADRDGLLDWLGAFGKKPCKIFIVHGEEKVMAEFAGSIRERFGIETIIPSLGDTYSVVKDAVCGEERSAAAYMPAYAAARLAIDDIIDRIRKDLDALAGDMHTGKERLKSPSEVERLKARLLSIEKSILEEINNK